MALQVWLPLNGDLRNQGLANVTVSNSGATVSNNGKIGKCYSFANSNYLSISAIPYSKLTNCSVCFWICLDAGNESWLPCTGQTTGYYFMATQNNTGAFYHQNIGTNTVTIYRDGVVGTTPLPAGSWHHYCITGLDLSGWSTFLINLYGSTSGGWNFTGRMNDFRIYDHCLSPKEVKEISKGLVLHYKLDDPYVETYSNIASSGYYGLGGSFYNGATGVYGYGDTNKVYRSIYDSDKKIIKIYCGSGSSVYPYIFFDNISPINTAGKSKTLSFDMYPHGSTRTASIYFYSYYSNNCNTVLTNTTTGISITTSNTTSSGRIDLIKDTWNHIVLTLVNTGTGNNDSGWGYTPLNGGTWTTDGNEYWLIKNIQVTEKDHDLPYIPIGSTNSSSIVYDCSGYNHNGSITGSLLVDSNIIKYQKSTNLNDGWIVSSNINLSGSEPFTISLWSLLTVSQNYQPIFWLGDNTAVHGICVHGSSANRLEGGNGTNNFDTIKTSIPYNVWTHQVITWDKSNIKRYINGELESTTSWNAGFGNTLIKLYLGHFWGSNLKGNSSDARVYCTALSADDVKELYNTSAYIYNDGTVAAMEFDEEGTSEDITKTGIIKVGNFVELANNTKVLSDGSLWVRVLHHNNPASYMFTSSNCWHKTDDPNLYSVLDLLKSTAWANSDGEYEFLFCEKLTSSSSESQFRWKQTSNPALSSTLSGYELISGSPGRTIGIMNKGYNAALHNGNSFWCQCGGYSRYNGGIAGASDVVTTGYFDLYVRMFGPVIKGADANMCQFYENAIVANQIIEI